MCGAMLVMVAVAVGVDAGWQPLPSGGMEYIIQINPSQLESFEAGQEVVCEVPARIKDLRSYRIRVGTAPLPQEDPPPSPNDLSLPEPNDVPRPLALAPASAPGPEKLASYEEPGSPSETVAPEVDPVAEASPSTPWLPLMLALAAFFGAFGGMLYTSWIAWEYRRRYQALLEQTEGR